MIVRTRRYSLVVFDWDGTLVDSTAIIARAIQDAVRDMGEPVPDDAAARFVIGLGLDDAIANVAPSLPKARYPELARLYRGHFLARESDIPLFDGAADLLVELEAAGHLLAVATGKSRAGLDHALERSGLRQRFQATRCGDEGFPKPHPDMLLHLMDRLGVSPCETLMIGDTTHDIELARNAGADSIAVAYGAHDGAGLAGASPLAVMQSVAELRRWLAAGG